MTAISGGQPSSSTPLQTIADDEDIALADDHKDNTNSASKQKETSEERLSRLRAELEKKMREKERRQQRRRAQNQPKPDDDNDDDDDDDDDKKNSRSRSGRRLRADSQSPVPPNPEGRMSPMRFQSSNNDNNANRDSQSNAVSRPTWSFLPVELRDRAAKLQEDIAARQARAAAGEDVSALPDSLDAQTDDDDDVPDVDLNKPSSSSLVGTCVHMCPDDELIRRELESDIQLLEYPDPGGIHPPSWTLRHTAVKRFRRSAADFKLDIPNLVRPPRVLERVCAYLEEWIMERDRQGSDVRFSSQSPSSLDVYQFIWDRTRMVRKDFTLQNYIGTGGKCSGSAVRCHERIARWHALCEHQLSHIPEFVTAQSQQNIIELGQTMKTLNGYYDDALGRATVEEELDVVNDGTKKKSTEKEKCLHGCQFDVVQGSSPVDFDDGDEDDGDNNQKILNNEALDAAIQSKRILGLKNNTNAVSSGTAEPEMRGLYILLTIDNDGGMEVLKYVGKLCIEHPQVYKTKPVQLALSIYKAKKEHNYAKFFSLLRSPSTPYLYACVMFKYVEEMRRIGLRIMSKTFGTRRKDDGEPFFDSYPLKDLVRLFCFESADEARKACQHFNIAVGEEEVKATISSQKDTGTKKVVLEVIRWRKSDWRDPRDPSKGTRIGLSPRKMIRTIESKLNGATRLAICRGDVSGEEATIKNLILNPPNAVNRNSSVAVALAQTKLERRMSQQQYQEEERRKRHLRQEQKRLEDERERKRLEEEQRKQEEEKLQRIQEEMRREAEKRRLEEEERAKQKAEEEERKRKDLLLKQEQERKRREEEELKRARELEAARIAAAAAAAEKERKRLEEEQRKAREKEEQRRRAEEAAIERKRQIELERKRVEEQRRQRALRELAERRRREEEARRAELLRQQREREEEEERKRKEKEEEERRIEEAWQQKVNRARKLLAWKRWYDAYSTRRYAIDSTKHSLSHIDPTFTTTSLPIGFAQGIIASSSQKDQVYPPRLEFQSDEERSKDLLFYRLSNEPADSVDVSKLIRDRLQEHFQANATGDCLVQWANQFQTGKSVVLFKLVVILPHGRTHDGIHLNQMIRTWTYSKLRFNEILTSEFPCGPRTFDVRTIVIDESDNNKNETYGNVDAALFVIPPDCKDKSEFVNGQSFTPSILESIREDTPRLVLDLDDGSDLSYSASVQRLISSVFKKRIKVDIHGSLNEIEDAIIRVPGTQDNLEGLRESLKTCCIALVDAYLASKRQTSGDTFFQGDIIRISPIRLGRIFIINALKQFYAARAGLQWTFEAKMQAFTEDMEFATLSTLKSTFKLLLSELKCVKNTVAQNERWSRWPPPEFATTISTSKTAVVPNYFTANDHLPRNWLDPVAQSDLESFLGETFQALATPTSLDSAIEGLVLGAPHEIEQTSRALRWNRNYGPGIETGLKWLEQKHQDTFVYLPRIEVARIIEQSTRETLHGDGVEKVIRSVGMDNLSRSIVRRSLDSSFDAMNAYEALQLIPKKIVMKKKSSAQEKVADPQAVTKTKRQAHRAEVGVSLMRVKRPRRFRKSNPFSDEYKESKKFTAELEAMARGEVATDMTIGGKSLSDILGN